MDACACGLESVCLHCPNVLVWTCECVDHDTLRARAYSNLKVLQNYSAHATTAKKESCEHVGMRACGDVSIVGIFACGHMGTCASEEVSI